MSLFTAAELYSNPQLFVSKMLGGSPIDVNLPVPADIAEIANLETALPGEDVYKFASLVTTADEVKTIDASGVITAVKVALKGKTPVSFIGLNTDKKYVLIDELLASPNQTIFTDTRDALVRGLDLVELRLMIKLIMDDSDVDTIGIPTSGDLYDTIIAAKHALEDYGDGYKLLAGSAVKEGIDNYDKLKIATNNYMADLPGKLEKIGITVRKIFGQVKYTGDGSAQALLDTNKFIIVATNSTLRRGQKPLWFIRRLINPEIAKLMDADVDNVQRALFVDKVPTQVDDTECMGFGVFAYESIAMANTNYMSIKKSVDLSSLL